jgi:hypothetical protein
MIGLLFATIGCGSSDQTAAGGSERLTNLSVFRELAERIGKTTMQQTAGAGSPIVDVRVLPRDAAWYIESGVRRGFGTGEVTDTSQPRLTAEFGIVDARLTYEHPRRKGFLGSRVVDRIAVLTLSTKVFEPGSGRVLLEEDVTEKYTDTVAMDELPAMENPAIPITQGVLPTEGFFSSIAEPLITLGAIAVAVFLLFSVRS